MVSRPSITYPCLAFIRRHADAMGMCYPGITPGSTNKKRCAQDFPCAQIGILETVGANDVRNQKSVISCNRKRLNLSVEGLCSKDDLIGGSGNNTYPVVGGVFVLHENLCPIDAAKGIVRPYRHRDCRYDVSSVAVYHELIRRISLLPSRYVKLLSVLRHISAIDSRSMHNFIPRN